MYKPISQRLECIHIGAASGSVSSGGNIWMYIGPVCRNQHSYMTFIYEYKTYMTFVFLGTWSEIVCIVMVMYHTHTHLTGFPCVNKSNCFQIVFICV